MRQDTRALRAVVVGAGAGGTLSIDALLASTRFELVGVADISPVARDRVHEKTSGSVQLYESAEDMLTDQEPDVVCVSTYAPSHLALTRLALSIPTIKGLLVEKPLGDSTAAGGEIVRLIRSRALPIVVPHGLMTQAAALEVIAAARSGRIGQLQVVEMECTGWDIVNAGIHWLQFFGALVEPSPITLVLAAADRSTRTYRDGMQVETEAITMARTSSGVRLLLNTGDDVPLPREGTSCFMRLIGTHGFIEYGAWEDFYTIVSDGNDRTLVEVAPFAVRGHQRHLEYLADQVERGTLDYSVPEASLLALDVVEAAYESARSGRMIVLPSDGPQSATDIEWNPGEAYMGTGGGRDGRKLR